MTIFSRRRRKSSRQSPLRGISIIAAGNGMGQVVTFFSLPVLSRIYSPDEFGVFTLAQSIASLVAPVALLGMHLAVVNNRRDSDVAPLAISSIFSLLIASIVLSSVFLIVPADLISSESLRLFLALAVPALLFVTGMNLLLNQLAVRSGQYGSIGHRNGVQSILISISQLALAFTASFVWFNGLIAGALFGMIIGVAIMLRFGRKYIRSVSVAECVKSVRGQWQFPVVFAPMNVLTLISQLAPVLFVIYQYGVAEGGQAGMAERIVAVPLALVGLAVGTVFVGELSDAIRSDKGGAVRLFTKTSKWLLLLGVAVGFSLFFFSPLVFPFFLGDEWGTASRIAQTMAIVAATRIVATPVRGVFHVLNRARLLVFAELLRVSLLTGGILATILFDFTLFTSLAVLYGILAVSDVFMWGLGLRAVKHSDKSFLSPSQQ